MTFKILGTYILLLIVFVSCSVKDKAEYYKYVYDYNTSLDPVEMVTEVDIWLSRLLYRKLVSINGNGELRNDLVDRIEKNKLKYIVYLKKNEKFHDGSLITGQNIKFVFERAQKKLSSLKLVKEIIVASDTKVIFKLKEELNEFIKILSSPALSIYKLNENVFITSGLYQIGQKDHEFLRFTNDKDYPEVVILAKKEAVEDKRNRFKLFDTFLDYSTSYNMKESLSYRIQETWGTFFNLKGKWANSNLRECFAASFDKEKLVKNLLINHKVTHSINSKLPKKKKCNKELSFEIQIPKELDSLKDKLCKYFQERHPSAKCSFPAFVRLLENVKNDEFDVVFLALTTDSPFYESNLDLLKKGANFRIINIYIEIPERLKNLKSLEFYQLFEKFVYDNNYFVSFTSPVRTVFGHNLSQYSPSLLSPSYDGLDNLKR